MFNPISKKTIGTTGVTLALLLGGLLASPVASAFAKPIDWEPVTRQTVARETSNDHDADTLSEASEVASVAPYQYFGGFFQLKKGSSGLAAIRRLDY
jgi:hypothetical protein